MPIWLLPYRAGLIPQTEERVMPSKASAKPGTNSILQPVSTLIEIGNVDTVYRDCYLVGRRM
jgi:hypothetical protein